MKHLILTLIVVMSVIQMSMAVDSTFQKLYSFSDWRNTNGLGELSDSGFLLLGGAEMMAAVRTDKYGDTIWTSTVDGPNHNMQAFDFIELSDGYLIGGEALDLNIGNINFYFVKLDLNGDTVWTKDFTDTVNYTRSFSMVEGNNGVFYSCGSIEPNKGTACALVSKHKANGDTLWTKSYCEGGAADAWEIIATSDGNLAFAGTIDTGSGNQRSNVQLVKIDTNGAIIWTKNYGTADWAWDAGFGLAENMSNGFVVVGHAQPSTDYNKWIINTDANGDSTWTTFVGDDDQQSAEAVLISSTGSIYVVGYTNDTLNGMSGCDVVKLKADGTIVWEKAYNTPNHNFGFSDITETADGGLACAGRLDGEMFLVKMDTNGITSPIDTGGVNPTAPTPPSNLTAVSNNKQAGKEILLSWTDNSNNEDEFVIERSTDSTNYTAIDSVNANVESYLNDGLDTVTKYYYRVYAYNTVGNSSYSNVASASTTGGGSIGIENPNNISFSVYPNPAHEVLNVELENNEAVTIQVFNTLGASVLSKSVEDGTQLNISDYPTGSYLIKVIDSKDGYQTMMFIKR